jgi:hypothetical protein
VETVGSVSALRRPLSGQLQTEVVQSGSEAAVDDVVPELHAQSADDGGVDHLVDLHLTAVGRGEVAFEALQLRRFDRCGSRDRGDRKALLVGDDACGVAEQLSDTPTTGLLHELTDDADGLRARVALEQGCREGTLGLGRSELAAERELELVVARDELAELEQLSLDVALRACGDRSRPEAEFLDASEQVLLAGPPC